MLASTRTETLLEKLQYLSAAKLAEVEEFVDSLRNPGNAPSETVIEDRLCASSPIRPAVVDLSQGHGTFACADAALVAGSQAGARTDPA